MTIDSIPCPFIYANGKKCPGHVVAVNAFKADLSWSVDQNGAWTFSASLPRSHYHLTCSEKGNHAGAGAPDADKLKFYYDQLPEPLRRIISGDR